MKLPIPPGPWDDEPDEVRWLTDAGLPAVIRRTPMGCLCGYVGVPAGHPLYGVGYDDARMPPAHGGVTYTEAHVPLEASDGRWWIGFDCAHWQDLVPAIHDAMQTAHAKTMARFGSELMALAGVVEPEVFGVYRDIAYVRGECEELATCLKQLEELGRIVDERR